MTFRSRIHRRIGEHEAGREAVGVLGLMKRLTDPRTAWDWSAWSLAGDGDPATARSLFPLHYALTGEGHCKRHHAR